MQSIPLYGVLPYPGQGNIYLYSNSGLYKELQVITSVNTRVNTHISLNGYWAWTDYHTNVSGIPSNEFNINQDWGRAAIPSNRFNLIGTLGSSLWMDGFSDLHGEYVDAIQYYDRHGQ